MTAAVDRRSLLFAARDPRGSVELSSQGKHRVPTCKGNAGSALDVIIEAAVRGSVLLQQLKGVVVGKILKLHHRVWLPLLQGRHKPLYDSPICCTHEPALPEALQDKSGSNISALLLEIELVNRCKLCRECWACKSCCMEASHRATPGFVHSHVMAGPMQMGDMTASKSAALLSGCMSSKA